MRKINVVIMLVCYLVVLSIINVFGDIQVNACDTCIDVSQQIAEQQNILTNAHQMADSARALGFKEDNDIIITAGLIWKDANAKLNVLQEISKQSNSDIYYISKTMRREAYGSVNVELAKIGWCVLNRVDRGSSIKDVVTQPNQFAYSAYSDGDMYYDIALDVYIRWQYEKEGIQNVGRVLPADYVQFRGDGKLNHYYKTYNDAQKNINEYTNWLVSPYEQ